MPTDVPTTPVIPPRTTNKRPRTPAQQEASRRNGARSRGPITADGKARSARNALKHGLAAETILPDAMAVELEAEIAVYERKFTPRDPVESRLVHRAALASLRWTRLAQAELAASHERERHARRRWSLTRRRRVRRLLAQLRDPNHPDPAGARDALRQTSLGCRHLAREHARLATVLDHRGALTPREIVRALRLAGHAATRLHFEAPPPEVRLWLCLLALAPAETLAAHLAPPLTVAELPLPTPAAARSRLTVWLRRRAARLRRRAVALRRVEAADRAQAPLRAAADNSPEGARLARYLNDADRQHRRALADLATLRRAPARNQPERPPASGGCQPPDPTPHVGPPPVGPPPADCGAAIPAAPLRPSPRDGVRGEGARDLDPPARNEPAPAPPPRVAAAPRPRSSAERTRAAAFRSPGAPEANETARPADTHPGAPGTVSVASPSPVGSARSHAMHQTSHPPSM